MDSLKKYYKLFSPVWEGYEVGELLGSGSFGDVYEFIRTDVTDAPIEAIKEIAVPPPSAGGMKEALFQGLDIDGARYYYEGMKKKALEEVEILKKFSECSNIIKIHDYKIFDLPEDYEEYGWIIFVRMELLKPLKEKIFQDGISILEIVNLGIDLCDALEACRKEGILHRDIKPENIFYSAELNKFKLGDFGIACQMSRVTEEKGLPGTLTHMAPEIYRGERFDYEADLYAAGMILYKLLNENRVPLLPDYPEKYSPVMRNQAIRRRLEGEDIPLPSITRKNDMGNLQMLKLGKIPKEKIRLLAEITTKAIASERKNRYSSPVELKKALVEWKDVMS